MSVPLSKFDADQYALMLLAGIPRTVAASYFAPQNCSQDELEEYAHDWGKQVEVVEAVQRHSADGTPWHLMGPEERLKVAVDKHYADRAYFLWSHNYSDLNGLDKQKADSCLATLEAKLAGTAGQGSVLDRLYEDVLKEYKKSVPKVITH